MLDFQLNHGARSQAEGKNEGLLLEMDVMLEFKVGKDEEDLNLVKSDFMPMYQILASNVLRNVVAKYEAFSFLNKERRAIGEEMRTRLNQTFFKYHAEVLSVQLFQVDLPDQFEGWIREVERLRLDQRKEVEQRNVAIAQQNNTIFETEVRLKADKLKSVIDATALVDQAELARPALITEAETNAIIRRLNAIKERNTTIIDVNKRYAVAQQTLEQQKTRANNNLKAALIDIETQKRQAQKDAEVILIDAKAEAARLRALGVAEAKAIQAAKEAKLQQFQDIKQAFGGSMTQEQILQYTWLQVLKTANDVNIYLDYKKPPLFIEGKN